MSSLLWGIVTAIAFVTGCILGYMAGAVVDAYTERMREHDEV